MSRLTELRSNQLRPTALRTNRRRGSASLPLVSRRAFLSHSFHGAAYLASLSTLYTACSAHAQEGEPPPILEPTESCHVTPDNIEGPYYRTGAPLRADLRDGSAGTPLTIQGRVYAADCAEVIPAAELDIWHATADGHYDNDGSMGAVDPGEFLHRGRVAADVDGGYALQTVVPGRYLNGPNYRPAHVHVKIRAAGYRTLTTQLYFPGDPYNEGDPFIRQSLLMQTQGESSVAATYDFVLQPA